MYDTRCCARAGGGIWGKDEGAPAEEGEAWDQGSACGNGGQIDVEDETQGRCGL